MRVITAPALYGDTESEPRTGSGWINKPIHLHYFISAFRFLHVKFPAMVLSRSLDPWTPAAHDPRLPLEGFPGGAQALFSSIYPICSPLRRTVRFSDPIRYIPHQY